MTTHRGFPIGAAIVLAAATFAGPSLAQRQTRERQVDVAVVDGNGAPVVDLGPEDFIVREDGIAREVLRIAPAPPPSHIGLLVDDSAAASAVVSELRQGLWAFVATTVAFEPPPHTGLMTYGDRPTRVAPHTPSVEPLQPAIDRLFARPGSGAYMLDAVAEECRELARAGATRPVIVAFVVESGAEFSQTVRRQVEQALRDAGASLWTVALQGRMPDAMAMTQEFRERAAVLTDVAAASGGAYRSVLTSQGLQPAMEQLAAVLGSRYQVTYGRPDSLVPPDRLEVSVRRPNLEVRAPRWPGR